MKTINLTLYSFDELSKEVQKEIINRERWNIMGQCMEGLSSDYHNSLEQFEKAFFIKCKDWEVNYCNYFFDFDITKVEAFGWKNNSIELETLSGKLLQRFIRNNTMQHLEKDKYYGKLKGVYPNYQHIKRYSRIFKEVNCPLTGCCYDMDLLDPILKYNASPDQSTNYRKLIKECLDSFFKSWHEEYNYWADDEDAICEELHHNQYENRLYYKNGAVYEGHEEEVA